MGHNILIVDDSASMRQLVAFTLKDAGFDVTDAADGLLGLAASETAAFDMIISDLNMPNMDGIEMIRTLRGRAGYKFTPIVMLTTESQEAKKAEGKDAGASGWIVKPFTPDQLLNVVKKFLR